MTISEGIQQKGKPFRVPDCSRDELPEFFASQGYKKGAEIGVHMGVYTEKFLKLGLEMYAIDPWMPYTGSGRTQNDVGNQNTNMDEAVKRLSPYSNCHIIRKTSMDALEDIPDNSLDFVYIDGDHSFRYIAEDLYEWAKKVRSGGVISGHDYYDTPSFARNVRCHVGSVIDAYVKIFDIPNFYIFGTIKDGDRRSQDKYPSWMWFKP